MDRSPHSPSTSRTDAAWLSAHWMPTTGNREFKTNPRLFTAAKGAYFTTDDGRQVFDGLSGLWCTGLGHARTELVKAVSNQIAILDYAPHFQYGHPLSFELANRIVERMPEGLAHVFFTDSGSEAADTSLKMARAYWSAKGKAGKTRFVGRAKGYHGVNFGGISVGGIPGNRKIYGQGIEADHLPHTQPPNGSFFRGLPPRDGGHNFPGVGLADELQNIINVHDASTIAAVIVEPFAGSAGVLVPPEGYLQRLREICDANDILLIFDEVITGFGRCGTWTAAESFGVTPDLINFAKQITNGVQPLGAVVVKKEIYETFMATSAPHYMLEFPHGYTYSAHPVACAAAIATLDLLESDNSMQRVQELAPHFERAVHGLRTAKHVLDIRNYGLAAGLTIASAPHEPAKRPYEAAMAMLKKGYCIRYGGDTIQLAPPFISTEQEIDGLMSALGDALQDIE
ncbi:MAG: aspartate aminotransferase family protein [Rhodospirillaceae bacterium]